MATFYHRTTQQAAWAILENGFRDRRGKYLMDIEVEGVWLSDVPIDTNEGTFGDAVLAVNLDEREIACYEVVEDGKPYREWIVPAAWLNANSRPRLLSDD